ncbi:MULTISPECIES: carbohydrate ABC transporter permease [unclassified Paenibacillus]|uniref:carbohydrate ABC transporter permease n=1 Tax=unclassified Paenibacillus TaxID=185978 RepID=UPI000CFA2B17|nr:MULTISPECIES: carbohydrate ABC transporter permease [unclassified Paenibacillus]MBJ9989160.1 carbohydrate ABC transporter permease [Paenibacillus sp. S28]PQP90064.1 sugar ABC transporter permease [Paenibacillus sp. AR247]
MTTVTHAKQKRRFQPMIIHIVLMVGSFLMVVPVLWSLLTSLKAPDEVTRIPITILPGKLHWDNFQKVADLLPFMTFYWNTVVTTLVKVLFGLLFSSLAAYAFARIHFPGRTLLFLLVLSVMMVPGQVFLIPQYLLMKDLGWLNSLKAITVTGMFSAYSTFLLRQFFLGLPSELEESARIDGCNPFRIYWNIMLPLAKPGLISVAIISTLWSWNDFLWPLVVNDSMDKMTLAVGLASLQGQFTTNYPVLMAGMLLAVWPMILIFFLLQKQFIEGITLGGLKG